jgi:hypothetical protein
MTSGRCIMAFCKSHKTPCLVRKSFGAKIINNKKLKTIMGLRTAVTSTCLAFLRPQHYETKHQSVTSPLTFSRFFFFLRQSLTMWPWLASNSGSLASAPSVVFVSQLGPQCLLKSKSFSIAREFPASLCQFPWNNKKGNTMK